MSTAMIRVEEIYIAPDRQREDKDISDLLPSIRARGIIQPIVVEISGGAFSLIAGERRLLCAKELKLKEVPARIFSSLLPVEKEIVELEENLHRKDLHWKDLCKAVRNIHLDYKKLNPKWTQKDTAEQISFGEAATSSLISVGEELILGNNKQIENASGWSTAYNIIVRRNQRRADDVFNELMEGEYPRSEVSHSPGEEPLSHGKPEDPGSDRTVDLIGEPCIIGDFTKWIDTYNGPPFTFIHCDFPYGIGLDKSDQGNSAEWGSYLDSEETYWELLNILSTNLTKLMAPSSHLMFWLSSDLTVINGTYLHLKAKTDLKVNPKPLIWYKSDNRGILPDPKRGPRHVYETAIFASRGDRFVNHAVSDAFSSPAGEKTHQSEKAEPMLRHFFRMFLDEGSSFLDPTCGSGTSLCAAYSFGTERIVGLELNPEFAANANIRFRKTVHLERFK